MGIAPQPPPAPLKPFCAPHEWCTPMRGESVAVGRWGRKRCFKSSLLALWSLTKFKFLKKENSRAPVGVSTSKASAPSGVRLARCSVRCLVSPQWGIETLILTWQFYFREIEINFRVRNCRAWTSSIFWRQNFPSQDPIRKPTLCKWLQSDGEYERGFRCSQSSFLRVKK